MRLKNFVEVKNCKINKLHIISDNLECLYIDKNSSIKEVVIWSRQLNEYIPLSDKLIVHNI